MSLANSNEVDCLLASARDFACCCFPGFSDSSTFRNDSHLHPEKISLSLEMRCDDGQEESFSMIQKGL